MAYLFHLLIRKFVKFWGLKIPERKREKFGGPSPPYRACNRNIHHYKCYHKCGLQEGNYGAGFTYKDAVPMNFDA